MAQINFKEPDAADACVLLLNNRWFGQRKITAETWDGKTKYKCVLWIKIIKNQFIFNYNLYIFTLI